MITLVRDPKKVIDCHAMLGLRGEQPAKPSNRSGIADMHPSFVVLQNHRLAASA
jgi:hypothetical protein